MVSNYQPKNPYFDSNKIQKQAKDLISTCYADRGILLSHFEFLMKEFKQDPDSVNFLQEATKTLPNLAKATDKVVKVLDIMSKLVGAEEDTLTDSDLKMLKSFSEMSKK